MAEFVYNNLKNVSTDHTSFELNCGYHLCVSFEDECNACSRSSLAKRLAITLRELINVCRQNLFHAQDLYKQTYNKGIKSQSYKPG